VLDTIGVALAGWDDTAARAVARYAIAGAASGDAQVIGAPSRIAPSAAALANATLAHALDFDDTTWSFAGHASAVLLPAVLAASECCHSSGQVLVRGFIAGFEAAARIGAPVVETFAARGWHLTSTVGVFGAAAATAVVLGLDESQIAAALGLAASRASGLKSNFGTAAKPLHVGFAARDGVDAAQLAQEGAGGRPTAIEARLGFYEAFAGAVPPHVLDGCEDLFLVTSGVAVKRYPTCTGSHPAIDAVLALVREHAIAVGDVEWVRCGTTPDVINELIYDMPSTAHEARFSMAFPVAAALLLGRVDLEVVSDGWVAEPAIRSLMQRCEMYVDPTLLRPVGEWAPAGRVDIHVRGGAVVSRCVQTAVGHPRNPMPEEELRTKFRECAGRRIADRGQVSALEDAIWELDRIDDVTALTALMRTNQS
jgi:2-methylcitrate dehydratase PrpD